MPRLAGNAKHAAYMANVCVNRAARRQGVGAALVHRVRQLCRLWGKPLEVSLQQLFKAYLRSGPIAIFPLVQILVMAHVRKVPQHAWPEVEV